MNEREIFLSALEIEDPAARQAHLHSQCAGDVELLASVEALLASHGQSQFLNTPVVEQMSDAESAATMVIEKGSTADEEYPHTEFYSHSTDAMSKNEIGDENPLGYLLGFLKPASRPDSKGQLAHYEIIEVRGRGAFGTVLKAFDAKLERIVAIKVLAAEMAATSPARKRFLREARASAAIRHENVVAIHAVEEQPLPYLVMEYIPGKTLQQRLDDAGPFPVIDVLRLGRQIAEGLAAAGEQGLIHRDIKPGNILLEAGVHERVKITDFGLARAADDASLTQSSVIAGTPMYMAPEQALGKKLDQRADLFSLGSVLYQMVSGRPPFRAASTLAVLKRVTEDTPRPITEVIPETPQWLCDIITKLHAKNPDERYQSAREVADVLANCEGQLREHSRLKDLSLIPRAKPQPAGWWKVIVVAALVCPFLAIGLYVLNRPAALLDLAEMAAFKVVENQTAPELPAPDAINPDSTLAINRMTEQGASASDGWVQLFNGKDLTGWKTHPDQPGDWNVDGGILVGSTVPSHLFSDSGKFANFHLRVEAKVSRGGDSGVYFRTPFSMRTGRTADQRRPAAGYEVELQANPGNLLKTGSVWDAERIGSPPKALWKTKEESLTKADEWFTLEIIADGNRVISKVNGILTADCNDRLSKYEVGHLALQIYSPETTVQFRKIEIKELPPSDPVVPSWIQLFNGKDLTGWKFHPKQPGDWNVKDGILYGSTRQSLLFSERGGYESFHLRAEVKINAGGDSGILFRAPFELPGRTSNEFAVGGCYEAELQQNRIYARPTGSISESPGDAPPNVLGRVLDGSLTQPDVWFTYEVIAVGNHFVTKINGIEAANCRDELDRHRMGHLALQVWSPQTVVQFRKVEIKELPSKPAPQEALPLTYKNSLGMEFVIVPRGKSWLGGGKDRPGDNEVELTADFYLGKYEVTQEEWEKVMGENPSYFSHTGGGADAVKDISAADLKRFPVDNVTWDQCQMFIDRLNKSAADQGWIYRLPKEVEWEYACRAGPMANRLKSEFDYYLAQPTNTLVLTEANFDGGTPDNYVGQNRTSRVGSFAPNVLGLHDMHGNTWEWCEDADTTFDGAPGFANRGGSWGSPFDECNAAFRAIRIRTNVSQSHGLRLARVPAGAR